MTQSPADVIDYTATPERLEQGIAETKCQQVLNRLFAKIVINAKDLVLFKA